MIDGIDEGEFIDPDFADDFIDDFDGDDDMYKTVGCKCVHTTGIEGVITAASHGYYWMTHSGGQEAFIHGGELTAKAETCTKEELEAYLGHSNGLPAKAA